MTYRKGDEVISVSYLPRKKRRCLMVGSVGSLVKVASFDDDEAAELFEKTLDYFFRKEKKQ